MPPRNKLDLVKDDVDALLWLDSRVTPRTDRRLAHRFAMARDLVEYIQIHYIDTLEADVAERKAERRRAREAK